MAKLNVRDAISAHVAWKVKLLNFFEGRGEPLDARKVSCDDCCVLGQWIHGEGGVAHGALPAFQDLKSKHAAFHKRAGVIVAAGKAGRAMLDASYDALSSDVVSALVKLKPTLG